MPYPSNYVLPEMRLNRFIDSNVITAEDWRLPQVQADVQATNDYSETPGEFYIQPPIGYMYEMTRILILITASGAISSQEYLAAGALDPGFTLEVGVNGTYRAISAVPITRVADWASYAGVDVRPLDTSVQTRSWAVRWTFVKAGRPLFIKNEGPIGRIERVRVVFNENLSSLTTHTGFIQGIVHKI